MSMDYDRQQIANFAATLLPGTILPNTTDIVISNNLYFLYKNVGNYATRRSIAMSDLETAALLSGNVHLGI